MGFLRFLAALPLVFFQMTAFADDFIIGGLDWRPMIGYAMSPASSMDDSAKIVASFVQAREKRQIKVPEILKDHQGRQCARYDEWPRGNIRIDFRDEEMNDIFVENFNRMAQENGANIPAKFSDRASMARLAGYLAYAYTYGEPPMCVCGGLKTRQFDEHCSVLEPMARFGPDGKLQLINKFKELSHWVGQTGRRP